MVTMIKVKYISLYDSGGYDIAARMYLKALIHAGIQVTWTPMRHGDGLGPGFGYEPYHGNDIPDTDLKSICNIEIPYDLVIVHTVPEYYPYWRSVEKEKKMLGMTVWETDTIPPHWGDLLNLMDAIIVPTNWNREIFTDCGVQPPIHVLPHISEFQGVMDNRIARPNEKLTFYSISDWTNRKTPEFTIEVFVKAFSNRDKVKLILKTSKFDYNSVRRYKLPWMPRHRRTKDTFDKLLRKLKPQAGTAHPEIELIDSKISSLQIQSLHQNSDCFVSLCRAEGWGLPAYEAGWFGNPVVMTGFGGQTAYLHADYSFTVNYDLIPVDVQQGRRSYAPSHKWGSPDLDHAISILRKIYADPESAKQKGLQLKKYLTENFDGRGITNQFLNILEAYIA